MSLLSPKEVLNLKLSCIRVPQLKKLASKLGISNRGSSSEIIKRILDSQPDEKIIDGFIRQRYTEKIRGRKS